MKGRFALVLLVLLAVLCFYPILFLLTGSVMGIMELKEYLGAVMENGMGFAAWRLLPLYPTLRSYVEVLLDLPQFFVMFWNSVSITVWILLGQFLVGVPAAWGLARFCFCGRKGIYLLYIILMMMPFQVRMLSDYLVLDQLQLLDSHLSIVLPGIFSTFPIFIMYRFFESIPEAILESARIDGAGNLQVFFLIGVPLGKGGIVSALVLGFLEYWNMVEQPLTFLKDKSLWPLALFLPNIQLEEAGVAFAASVITLIPSVFVFLMGQDDLEQGIAAAAVKG